MFMLLGLYSVSFSVHLKYGVVLSVHYFSYISFMQSSCLKKLPNLGCFYAVQAKAKCSLLHILKNTSLTISV